MRGFGFCLILGAIALCPVATAVSTKAGGSDSAGPLARATAVADDSLREDVTCVRCHEKVVKTFVNNPHASQERRATSDPGVTCADCHGPGQAHIQSSGDKSKIFNPAEAAAKQVNTKCLQCHAGKHAIFERTAHGKNNVSCIRCHSIHAAHESRYLLFTTQPGLCFQCHEDQRPQFSEPSHHKVVEGLVLCTDCHEPHGSFGEQLPRFTAQQDFICTKCHTGMAGPFEYDHGIIKTEGCIACHFPHGGPNAHMLNRGRVNTICLLCHFPSQSSSKGESLIHAHDPASVHGCTDCHLDIHGSNVSPVFLKKE